MKKLLFIICFCLSISFYSRAQNTFPSTGNVGIGITSPDKELEVNGDILLRNSTGIKQIFTWTPTDTNWRIGMNANPGFNRSMLTTHVQFLTYAPGITQGFAVGVNGGNSSLEIRGSDHTAFFRGNVGIGTYTPGAKLEVKSSNNLRTLLNKNDQSAISFLPNNGNSIFHISHGLNNDLNFSQGSNVGGGNIMTIKNIGNVGIGTTNPGKKLDVDGDIRLRGDLATLNFQRTTNTTDIAYIQYDHNNMNFNIATSGKTIRFINKGNWSESMRLTPYGSLGIGTTNPDAKLTVAGKIHSQEVKVTVNAGADFVFEDNYKLPDLKDTELFIKKNKHLPEIASEKDMQENGIYLADMNIKLLQKIEELTLYTINQEKRIETLESKNDKLAELVEKLLDNTNEK